MTKIKVLIVENNIYEREDAVEAVKQAAENKNFEIEVTLAKYAKKALTLIEQGTFDIVLTSGLPPFESDGEKNLAAGEAIFHKSKGKDIVTYMCSFIGETIAEKAAEKDKPYIMNKDWNKAIELALEQLEKKSNS